MDTLNGMRLFVRVADAKSFTKAAALASVTNAQLTRAIAELESRLRTRLLNRTTRRMSLTEAGERYLRRCEEILECVDLAESEARGASLWPSGRLQVHCSTGFGQHYLAPAIARYNREYPEVEIELVLAQRAPDMIEEGFDVSVVVSPELPPSSFVAQRIGSASIVLCASPTYLSARGHPGRLSDLNHHTCLQLAMPGSSAGQWGCARIPTPASGRIHSQRCRGVGRGNTGGHGHRPVAPVRRASGNKKRHPRARAVFLQTTANQCLRALSVTALSRREDKNFCRLCAQYSAACDSRTGARDFGLRICSFAGRWTWQRACGTSSERVGPNRTAASRSGD